MYCPQIHNWISHFTLYFVAALPWKMQPHTSSQKLLNKSAMHVVISLLLQSRKVISLTDLFDAASPRHNDVILLPAIHRVSGNDIVFQQDSQTVDPHTTPCTCNSWTAASRNAKLFCTQPAASKQSRSLSCGLQDLVCHAASCQPQTYPQCGRRETAAHWCLARSWTVDFWRGYWPVVRKTSSVCPC